MNETRKEEITKRLEAIEDSLFYHNMADRWDIWEAKEVDKLKREKDNLLKELKEEKKEEKKEEIFEEIGKGKFNLTNSKERKIYSFDSKEEAMDFYWKIYKKEGFVWEDWYSNF